MTKLLPNLPVEDLTKDNDYIGIIEKGDLIKSFFLSNKHEFSRIKIFSIYGEWGSGKSTLMKYLQKKLRGSFNTFFFESWEFESDDNLASSLLELLVEESNSSCENLRSIGNKVLEGFAKSVTLKIPIANINFEKVISELDNLSFYQLKENFKKEFIAWENKITTGDKMPEYNIVFIDDLDRCEPENVLNLLSAIKLFFTFGKKTIFLCGIDRKAISEAVKTKYGEVVKANEYLEKIFDVSFSMPKDLDIRKLIGYYFEETILDYERNEHQFQNLILNFFKQLNFTNPRRIKKILNKYALIENLVINNNEAADLPGIKTKKSGTLFETYLTIYLLIIKEFEPRKYETLFNLNTKRANFVESMNSTFIGSAGNREVAEDIFSYFDEGLYSKMFKNYDTARNDYDFFITYFVPNEVTNIEKFALYNKEKFITSFRVKNKGYEYYFTVFLYKNRNQFVVDMKKSNYSLLKYKKIISDLI